MLRPRRLPTEARHILEQTLAGLPVLIGRPVFVSLRPHLTAHRGKLLTGMERGTPVYAASFIRARQIVLEAEIARDHTLAKMILTHELFHFVWVRLNNRQRRAYGELIARELSGRARGEVGESSGVKKEAVMERKTTAALREYVCESFCDTAAWHFSGLQPEGSFTLANRWRARRSRWFENTFGDTLLV